MLWLQALVLGLLQGLTEFLPVSSSGHLQGVPYLLGWEGGGSLGFDVLVHAATLVAVVAYFRQDLLTMATDALTRRASAATRRRAWTLIAMLAIGSLPAGFAGIVFEDVFEAAFASPRAVAFFLYLTGVLLWTAERIRARRVAGQATGAAGGSTADPGADVTAIRSRDALGIGFAQALAIFPGVSRAGATIAAGMALGLSRTAAARFSFLLSIPIILGATAVTVGELGTPEPDTLDLGAPEMALGAVAAAGSGYWAITTLLRVVQHRDLLGFARYVVVFATVLLAATFIRG